jgi:hypothetical protein
VTALASNLAPVANQASPYYHAELSLCVIAKATALRPRASRRRKTRTASQTDLDTLKNIRKAITDDKDLSTCAHNVKITVKNGQVIQRP